MIKRTAKPRLTDIIEAIELIKIEMKDETITLFASNRRKQLLIERCLEIISEASRHLNDELKVRHTQIPWRKVAGIGNVLRHDYERVAPDVIWKIVHNDLPHLEEVCRFELEQIDDQHSA